MPFYPPKKRHRDLTSSATVAGAGSSLAASVVFRRLPNLGCAGGCYLAASVFGLARGRAAYRWLLCLAKLRQHPCLEHYRSTPTSQSLPCERATEGSVCPVGTCAKRKTTRSRGVKRAAGTSVPAATIERPGRRLAARRADGGIPCNCFISEAASNPRRTVSCNTLPPTPNPSVTCGDSSLWQGSLGW